MKENHVIISSANTINYKTNKKKIHRLRCNNNLIYKILTANTVISMEYTVGMYITIYIYIIILRPVYTNIPFPEPFSKYYLWFAFHSSPSFRGREKNVFSKKPPSHYL